NSCSKNCKIIVCYVLLLQVVSELSCTESTRIFSFRIPLRCFLGFLRMIFEILSCVLQPCRNGYPFISAFLQDFVCYLGGLVADVSGLILVRWRVISIIPRHIVLLTSVITSVNERRNAKV